MPHAVQRRGWGKLQPLEFSEGVDYSNHWSEADADRYYLTDLTDSQF